MAATRRLQRLLDHQRPAQPRPDATPTAGQQQPKRDWCAAPFRTVVALGESTTAGGWSTSPERCWVSQLGKLLNDFLPQPCDVINSGIGVRPTTPLARPAPCSLSAETGRPPTPPARPALR